MCYSYPANHQTEAKWVLSDDKQFVTQTVNADPSVFLSDRELLNTTISGTWLVTTADDDDFIGFVFAWQNPGQFYLFDWKSAAQNDSYTGDAKQGMAVKVVNVPCPKTVDGSRLFDGKDLWDTAGVPGKVKLLNHEPVEGWERNKPYQFRLDFHPGKFRIVVKDGERLLYDKTFHDQTSASGRFGFYNFSQDGVVYRQFQTVELGTGIRWLWLLLAAILLLLVGLALVVFLRRRRRRTERKPVFQPLNYGNSSNRGTGL